jgi:hypothetical protein
VLIFVWDGRRVPEEIKYQNDNNADLQTLIKDVKEIRDTLHRQ